MSFVPAFFSKFGRTTNDLLTLKFDVNKDDFKHQAAVKTTAENLTVTSSCTRDGDNLTGKVTTRCDIGHADITTEYNTAGRIKNTIRSSKIYRGLLLSQETEYKHNADASNLLKNLSGKVTAEYSQDGFAGSLEYNSKSNAVLSSAVIGFDGISIGGAAVVDVDQLSKNTKPQDAVLFDGGVQYENGNIIATATLESNKNTTFSLFHRVSTDFQFGSKYVVLGDSTGSILSSGFQYRVSPSFLVKGRASIFSDQSYVLYAFGQHRLQNPDLTVGLSAMRDSNNKYQVGVSIAAGEY